MHVAEAVVVWVYGPLFVGAVDLTPESSHTLY